MGRHPIHHWAKTWWNSAAPLLETLPAAVRWAFTSTFAPFLLVAAARFVLTYLPNSNHSHSTRTTSGGVHACANARFRLLWKFDDGAATNAQLRCSLVVAAL